MKHFRRIFAALTALLLLAALSLPVFAEKEEFEYTLTVTDQNGRKVTNPRSMSSGDTLNIEIELNRVDANVASFETYGMEFRMMSRGLEYRGDGASFRNNTPVRLLEYDSGDSVGFAYYDMEQQGVRINNPVLACKWSYTVTDPSAVNITVPVALLYVVNNSDSIEPVGNAILYLDPNGGKLLGEDLSGEYRSGTMLTLPDAEFQDYVFLGWSDGAQTYPAGSYYVVSGIVTLTAVWEGMVRDRQIVLSLNGGELAEGDIDVSGMYADGETIILPHITREGYRLLGWSDGVDMYQPGDEYTVYNSVVITPVWEEITEQTETTEPPPETVPTGDKPIEPEAGGSLCWLWWLLGILAAGLLLWWLILLWKRSFVLYSLKTGDVALDYKNKDHDFELEVILRAEDGDGNRVKHSLNKSGMVEKGKTLRYIHGQPELYPIVQLDAGKYRGYLLITDPEGATEEQNCRIKVLDRELKERKND